MPDHVEITGGASPEVAAAIGAVLAAIEQQEREAASVRPRPIKQSQWIRAGRPLDRQAPSSSADYDRLPGYDDGAWDGPA
ncbi:MAG: hypothetical protein KDB69_04295 [Acidimicrobiia bacterium]|nr:hypothetical protein [Acidimicrobiia bacterium]